MESLYTFPESDDYRRISDQLKVPSNIEGLLSKIGSNLPMLFTVELDIWSRVFFQRVQQAENSLVTMLYLFEQGINDEEWYVEIKGGYKLLPNFKEKDHKLKYFFDNHSDIFLYKVSSALDNLAHIGNILYSWDIYKPSFDKCWNHEGNSQKVRDSNPDLYDAYRGIIHSDAYKRFRALRNDFTHNYPPSEPSTGVVRYKNGQGPITELDGKQYITTTSFSGKNIEYVTSKEMKDICIAVWGMLVDIIENTDKYMK